MVIRRATIPGSGGSSQVAGEPNIPSDPNKQLGFELNPAEESWSFAPTFYPSRFTQTKERDHNRDGRACVGENVTLSQVKNREFHAAGVILASEVSIFQRLLDYDSHVDLISPITPGGGMECHLSTTELGNWAGYDPLRKEHTFEYTIDLISTGRDEYNDGENAIVSEILSVDDTPGHIAGSQGLIP